MKNNRRDFLKIASMGVMGASLPKATNAFFEPGIYPAKLSV